MAMRPTVATVTTAVVSLALGFALGAVPRNSVGSPQIKNGQVASADLKNGGVTSQDVKDETLTSQDVQNGTLTSSDLAAGTLPTVSTLLGTSNTFDSGCSVPGWCYLTNASSGTVIADFNNPPAISAGWTSTGALDLDHASHVLLHGTVNLWWFGSGTSDVMCWLRDGLSGSLVGTGWIRGAANTAQIVTIDGVVQLPAGSHAIRMLCRSTVVQGSAPTSASITATVFPNP